MNSKTLLQFLLIASLLGAGRPALGFQTKITKIHAAKNLGYVVDSGFGSAFAMSDRWILAGEPYNGDGTANAGAVHVYNAVTGAHVRKLVADDVPEARSFGTSVAIHGKIALIGAITDSEGAAGSGAVYVFDLNTGKQLRKLKAADATADSFFGMSVAVSGGLALVGAWLDDEVANDSGAAYVFDINTGAQLWKLTAGDGGIDHLFGYEVEVSGLLALVAAPRATGAMVDAGAVYVFDMRSGAQIYKLTASDGKTDDLFGCALAADGANVLIGAQGNDALALNAGAAYLFNAATAKELIKVVNTVDGGVGQYFGATTAMSEGVAVAGAIGVSTYRGAAYLIDLRTGQVAEQLLAADGEATDFFGLAVAIHGNRVVIGASGDDDKALNTGGAYLYQLVPGTLPQLSLARSGGFAAGALNAEFASFKNACISRSGAVSFDARLRGAGSNGGRDQGGWSTLGDGGGLGLLLKSRDVMDSLGVEFAGVKMSGVLSHSINLPKFGMLRTSLMGAGVNARNNQAVFVDNGVDLKPVLRTGMPQLLLGNAEILAIRDVVQNRYTAAPLLAIGYQLRPQDGMASAKDDSGVLFAEADTGSIFDVAVRENEAAPGGGVFGQFPGRVALNEETAVFPTIRFDLGVARKAVFKRQAGAVTSSWVDEGTPAPGAGAATFKAFVAEGATFDNGGLCRATLAGAGVTSANNEGIWHEFSGLIARKGDQVPGETVGVVWQRFLGFWPVADSGVLIHAQVKGPGINGSNAIGIWVKQEDGSLLRLMRQGDAMTATDGAKIKTIQRIEVETTNGAYAILASLTGAAGRNQALFSGYLALGDPGSKAAARLPQLRLRKGQRFAGTESSTVNAVTSMALAVSTDAGGSGAKGLGQSLNGGGQIALRVTLDNKASEIVSLQEIKF